MVVVKANATGKSIRARCRNGSLSAPTSGLAPGYVQANIVILPAAAASDFQTFCQLNPRACPLLAMSPEPGVPTFPELGDDIDIRVDLPKYRVWRNGDVAEQAPDISEIWEADWTAFALGCSFSFEEALLDAGIEIRNITEGVNVPMYITQIPCATAGPFAGKMVVSMRPMVASDAIRAIQICSRFPSVHGAPIHLGDPSQIGIANLNNPDFGEAVAVKESEIPLFWACGVTPQVALQGAKLPLAVTHEPGHMLVTDLKNTDLAIF
jgi:uncharacterized protein YcsI (UPF0317 family)